MKISKIRWFFIIVALISFSLVTIAKIPNNSGLFKLENDDEVLQLKAPQTAASLHGDIYLVNDTELANLDVVTGNGSANNPYIIQDLIIPGGSLYPAITLVNITSYVIVRNIIVELNYSAYYPYSQGLKFENCPHLKVESCYLSEINNGGSAISAVNCPSVVITNCEIVKPVNNSLSCISIKDSNNAIVSNNKISNANLGPASGDGIYVNNSQFVTVLNNTLNHPYAHPVGFRFISANYSPNIEIINNSVQYGEGVIYGVLSYLCPNMKIQNLELLDLNAYYFEGVAVYNSNGSLIEGVNVKNVSSSVTSYGITLSNSESVQITKNTFTDCFIDTCIRIDGDSHGNWIFNNIIGGGQYPVLSANADNQWYGVNMWLPAGTIRTIGNYYWNYTGVDIDKDFIGDSPFSTTNCNDPYPLMIGGFDTDKDGLYSGIEISQYGTNPNQIDTDGDGWTDYQEIMMYGTNPLKQDTDMDGLIDSVDPIPDISSQSNVTCNTTVTCNSTVCNSTITPNYNCNVTCNCTCNNTLNCNTTALDEVDSGSIPGYDLSVIFTIGIVVVTILVLKLTRKYRSMN